MKTMTRVRQVSGRNRTIAVGVVAAFLAGDSRAVLGAAERKDVLWSSEIELSSNVTLPPSPSIRASIVRWASIESRRIAPSQRENLSTASQDCKGASVAEKLAFVYALVGGTLLLVYGPQEKEGDVWTLDGKSETVAGAAAIGLSVALFRDIRAKKR